VFGFGVEVGLQHGKDGLVHATRAETGRVQCGDADLGRQQQFAVAQDLLVEDHAGLLQLDQTGAHLQGVIQPCRPDEIHLHRAHREDHPVLGAHALLAVAQRTHPFGPGPFHEGHVAGVVDHAASVGIFPVNACRPTE